MTAEEVEAAKAMKAMKTMNVSHGRKKMVRKSKASLTTEKQLVLDALQEKTAGGLTATDLFINKRGKVVSKKEVASSSIKAVKNGFGTWVQSVRKARAILKSKGTDFDNGGPKAIKKGTLLYTTAKEIFDSDRAT